MASVLQSTLIQNIVSAVRKANKGIGRDFGEVSELAVSRKGPGDFVTMADRRVEAALREELLRLRPGYGFVGEETGEEIGTDKSHRWIVDPIDGTTNFIHGIAHFATTVALEREGDIVAGVTYNPITNDLYWSEKGKGAFNNDRRLRVSSRKVLADCLIGTGAPFVGKPGHAQFLKELHQITGRTAGIRRMGAASLDLAYIAAGRFDGFWERGLKMWDIAAGLLFVQEAGGRDSSLGDEANPILSGDIVVGNPEIAEQLAEKLNTV